MQTVEGTLVRRVGVRRVHLSHSERLIDTVAVEEPLEMRLRYWFKDAQHTENLAVTMRTPGQDRELAAGFLYSEGLVREQSDIEEIRVLGSGESNELLIELSKNADLEMWRASRATAVNSSCGVCGKRSIESLEARSRIEANDDFRVSAAWVNRWPALLNANQTGFAQTGGLHAAALVTPGEDPRLEAVFEDIGRHNALDKVLGWCLLKGQLPLRRRVLFLSSRSSFELVQKAATAGAPVLATIGSPSTLAVDSARRFGLTLVGFVRSDRFNIYSGEWRINSK